MYALQSYHDKVLYSGEVSKTHKNLQMLCLPAYCCEPFTAQASDEVVLPPRDSACATKGWNS